MTARNHLPALDGVRGLAVLIVFVGHAANDGLLPGWLGHGSGQTGVQLFFVLSGYLMMRHYGATPFGRAAALAFATGRAARILPLYWLVLGLAALGAAAGVPVHYRFDTGAEFLAAAALAHAPQELWSVPVEAQFYAAFVVLWWTMGRAGAGRLAVLLAAGFCAAVIWRGLVSEAAVLVPYVPAFLGGVLCARLGSVPSALAGPRAALVCLGFLALNLPGVRPLWLPEIFSGFYPRLWLDPLRLLAIALVFLAALSPGAARMWSAHWLGRIGTWSFCIYLIHRPLLRAALPLAETMPGWAVAMGVLALTTALAALSLRFIERPAARALKAAVAPPKRPAPQPQAG